MTNVGRIIAGLLLRAIVILAISELIAWALNLMTRGDGANIGAGLIAFAAMIIISAVWAYRDGRREGARGELFAMWIGAGLLLGLLTVLKIQLPALTSGRGFDTSVALSDLVLVAPFQAGLVIVPACVALAIAGSRGGPGRSAAGESGVSR